MRVGARNLFRRNVRTSHVPGNLWQATPSEIKSLDGDNPEEQGAGAIVSCLVGTSTRLRNKSRAPTALFWLRACMIALAFYLAGSNDGGAESASPKASGARVDFNRDIRPILSDTCYACHGPDVKERKAKLRFDLREEIFKPAKSGEIPVVPGDLAKSELIRRITTADEDDLMPPSKFNKKLTPAQVELFKRWVSEGAEWKGHWSYNKPEQPGAPEVKSKPWVRNPIDSFVAAKLEKEGLKPSPEADKAKLARRVALDLTGLPPTIDEVDQFLYDNSADAYEKLVDRLLATPAYGERRAMFWLDLARYSDSQGYHHDAHRDLYHWRDWVINAFNKNMPFDQFSIEQLAGDLLPKPTRDQIIATGFHRNEMTTSEGGAIPEEYAVKYIVGRLDTTARVWLGTSLACAECHDHKYDPITQKDFYRLFAFFNTVAENGMDQQENPVPRLTLETPEQKTRLEQMNREVAALDSAQKVLLESPHAERDTAQTAWQTKLRNEAVEPWTVLPVTAMKAESGAGFERLADDSIWITGTNAPKDVYEITLRTETRNLTALRLEVLPDDALPQKKWGRGEKGEFLLTKIEAEAGALKPKIESAEGADGATPDSPILILGNWFSLGAFKAASEKEAYDKAFGPESGVDLAKTYEDGKLKWTEHLDWKDTIPRSELCGTNAAVYLHRTIKVTSPRWVWLSFGKTNELQTWMNGRKVSARNIRNSADSKEDQHRVYLISGENKLLLKISNGGGGHPLPFNAPVEPAFDHPVEFTAAVADFNQNGFSVGGTLDSKPDSGWAIDGAPGDKPAAHFAFFRAQEPLGFPGGTEIKLRLKFESERPQHTLGRIRFAATTSEGLTEFFGMPDNARAALIAGDDQRTPTQKLDLQKHYRLTLVPEIKDMAKVLGDQRKARDDFQNSLPLTMVMGEMEKPRDTFLLIRGDYQKRGEKMTADVPSQLFPWQDDLPRNRLGFAKWLMHPDNPLTPRVIANHYWLEYFGTGIVKTSEEFGSQGEWPVNPELLDWLATELVRSKWDLKAFQRLIVTSATYRQSAAMTPELQERDPEGRLLARFPRHRLEAEAIRDSAMTVSGLINRRIGGPSVYPYQPPGLWEAVAFEGTRQYIQSKAEENYRRGIYTYWRRSLPYPSLVTFDAPPRETCTMRRPRTNTPLQALVLMNDPVYVEASRAFGQRILREGGGSFDARLNYAFKTCLGRPPTRFERTTLEKSFQTYLKNFEQDRIAASKLIHVGASAPPVDMDLSELAAWTVIANTLLNLDETVTKG